MVVTPTYGEHTLIFMSNPKLIQKASSGVIKDFYSDWNDKQSQKSTPETNLDLTLRMAQEDATIKAALTTLVDGVLGRGYSLSTSNNKENKKLEKKLKELRFGRLLRRAVYNLMLYGNAFIELVKKGEEVKELHLLETTTMAINHDKHGEVINYIQNPQSVDEIKFSKDNIVHISLSNITTRLWGDVDVRSIQIAFANKQYLSKYLNWYLGSGKYRDQIHIPSSVSTQQVKTMLGYYKEGEADHSKPFIAHGGKAEDKVEVTSLREFPDVEKIVKGLERYDREILMLLQVPPILVGIPDNSNRSGSVTEMDSFVMRVRGIQEVLADEMQYELFPKMGYEEVEVKFKLPDYRLEKDDVEIAVKLNSISVSRKQIEYFLKNSGIEFDEGDLFDEYDRTKEMVAQHKDAFPSRNREDKHAMPEDKEGTGKEETRKSQLVSKGYTPLEAEDIMRNL